MSRVILGLAVAATTSTLVGGAFAADQFSDPFFRPAYPTSYQDGYEPLGFEVGLRYWYALGGQNLDVDGARHEVEDQSHLIEAHLRIDDYSTDTYLKANAGLAVAIDGTYNTPLSGGDESTQSGTIVFAGADFGYTPFGTDDLRFGGLVGYQYINDSVYMGRAPYRTANGGGASEPNSLEAHALRLGVTARAEFDMFDFTVDAAVIPYAHLRGTYGAYNESTFTSGGTTYEQGSAASVIGSLYGGAINAMVGFRATDNIVIRAGARGYYLTGPVDVTYNTREVGSPGNEQAWIRDSERFELFRWGPVVELTATF
jgi:hypothetical protein